MPRYYIRVVVDMNTLWEADSKDEALRKVDEWVGENYGDLKHKCDYIVTESK